MTLSDLRPRWERDYGPAFSADDVLPAACGYRELCRTFRIGKSRVFKLADEGAFKDFELVPHLGPKRWSGILLQAYLRRDVDVVVRAMKTDVPKLRLAKADLRRTRR